VRGSAAVTTTQREVRSVRMPVLMVGLLAMLSAMLLAGCVAGQRFVPQIRPVAKPLTASSALGLYDSARDASLRLVVLGLDDDQGGQPSRAIANYQRAVSVDPTNPYAFLALSRHHLEGGSLDEASAFLDQARASFEAEGQLGPAVDVWGLGLRAGIERARGRTDRADVLFAKARDLSPNIWADERLSAAELR
jgi:tetratricopeptide (TPR) repeat protein